MACFYVLLLPFLLEWNSYSDIPKPLNLVPNLPGWPSLHVPSISNINSLTMSAQGHTHTGLGAHKEGREEHMLLCWSALFQHPGKKKQRIWSTEYLGLSSGKPHYCPFISKHTHWFHIT